MSSIRLANVVFAYPQHVSLISSCTLDLSSGWTGIVGRNGEGKSTLLNLIAGTLKPQSGHVDRGGLTVSRCDQITSSRDAVEHFATSWTSSAMRWMSLMQLEPQDYWRWEKLSPGLQRRWQIGAALAQDPGVLLLDEPTNHLDVAGRDVLVEALRHYDGIGLVVSHDRGLLEAICASTIRVHRGEVSIYRGAYEAARKQWCAEERAAMAELASVQAEARGLKRQLNATAHRHASSQHSLSSRSRMNSVRDSDARSMSAKGRAQRAEASIGNQKGVVRAELDRVKSRLEEMPRPESRGGEVFVDTERCRREVVLHYEGELRVGTKLLAEHVELCLRCDDRVWLRGPNGCGKTTLIRKALEGWDLPPERLLQVRQQLDEARARREFDALGRDERSRALQIGAAICLDVEAVLDGTLLSPGEVRKLTIAVGFVRSPWLIVLDEPTNDLDLDALERLESALGSYTGALLMVTHDTTFAERLGARPIHLRDLGNVQKAPSH